MNNPSIKEHDKIKPINFTNLEKIMRGQSPNNPYYINFIKHRFPIHYGSLSDSFDWYEKENKVMLKVIKLMAELNYPIIISTKGTLMAEEPWYSVLKDAAPNKNFIFQFSIITNNKTKSSMLEEGAPTVDERFAAMKKMSSLGYWCVLRLRPYIIGASNDGIDELFRKASEAGARALSTEFYCLDTRLSFEDREMHRAVSKAVGFDIEEYYKALSPTERGGYRRLNRDVKEPYIKQMWLLCKKYNMQFNCSDPDFKELNQSGSCCGVTNDKTIYNSDCTNWSRGQLTNMLHLLMKRYLAGETDLYLRLEDVMALVPNGWMNETRFYGDSLKNWHSDAQNKEMNYKGEFIQTWNNTGSAGNPYNYFHGLLKPVGLDENNNVIYKFNPPIYLKKWRKEGII